jgi:energy-coupling factor transporter ATP-binding protein EcfA2
MVWNARAPHGGGFAGSISDALQVAFGLGDMYVQRIRIKNVKCFRDVAFDFQIAPASEPGWTLLLGNNGTGKTTLLRSLAMGLCDETSASGLLRELRGEFIRVGEKEAEIDVELRGSHADGQHLTISTRITRTTDGTEEVSQETTPERSAQIFACGYGARRAVIGSEQYERYRLIESLYTLFNYDSPLLNPEVYLYRYEKAGGNLDDFLKKLETVLMLPDSSVRLDSGGFSVEGPWGSFVPVGAIGDGYAATLSWVCDLFGWSTLFEGGSFAGDFRGIVLLDEIEQHLHPAWQRQLVKRLSQAFPKIQFIASTHSPLTVVGSASLRDQPCQLVLFEQRDDAIAARAGLSPPRNRRADQVLTSHLFGLASTTSDQVEVKVARYSQLASRQDLTGEEIAERKALHDELTQTLGGSETDLQERVRRAVHEALKTLAHEGPDPHKFSPDAVDFEVRRQLAELFEP